jgi:hypothetical protein
MLFWFVGTAVITVWYVFRDPRFDYRLLVVGSLLPELDAAFGGMRWWHSVTVSVVLMVVVMAITAGRKPARKLLLGLPIGTFLHLVFDGAWASTDVFWWPFTGWSIGDERLPSAQRGWWNVPLEAVGLAIVVWGWRRAGLGDAARRRRVIATGQLFVAGEKTATSL